MGRFLKEFYSKFDTVLTDSVSLIRILERNRYSMHCPPFTIDFKSLYILIPIEDAIARIQKLVFDFQTVILNAHYGFTKQSFEF